jgi:hypothetical protein
MSYIQEKTQRSQRTHTDAKENGNFVIFAAGIEKIIRLCIIFDRGLSQNLICWNGFDFYDKS